MSSAHPPEPPQKESRAEKHQQLVTQALEYLYSLGLDTFMTPQRESFARYRVDDHLENWPIASEEFTYWLEQELHAKYG